MDPQALWCLGSPTTLPPTLPPSLSFSLTEKAGTFAAVPEDLNVSLVECIASDQIHQQAWMAIRVVNVIFRWCTNPLVVGLPSVQILHLVLYSRSPTSKPRARKLLSTPALLSNDIINDRSPSPKLKIHLGTQSHSVWDVMANPERVLRSSHPRAPIRPARVVGN